MHGGNEKCIQYFSLETPKQQIISYMWEENIRLDIEAIGCKGDELMLTAQDTAK